MKDFLLEITSSLSTASKNLPKADDSFMYVGTKAISTWPFVNGNGAAFLKDDLRKVIGTNNGFKFGLANMNHSVGEMKTNQVLGTIIEENLGDNSVDIVAQIDRRSMEAYGVKPEDFMPGGDLSKASIEILCDREKSKFVAITSPGSAKLEDQTVFTPEEAQELGIMRTVSGSDSPYLYLNKYRVAEVCSPIRCRGIAFLDDPADQTALVFEVAAGMEEKGKQKALTPGSDYADPGFQPDGKERYPLDTIEFVKAALDFWGRPKYREKYTKEQQDHISRKILAAKKKFGIGLEEKSGFAETDTPSVNPSSQSDADSMMSYYDDVTPMDIQEAQDLPDDAFSESYFDPENIEQKRQYPLFASKQDYLDDKPHPALVHAALRAFQNGNFRDPNGALQKMKAAHNKIRSGDSNMDDKDKLATEKAALETRISELEAAHKTELSANATELAAVKTANETLTAENAELKKKIAERDANELANQRFEKLVAIEGFEVKDEEKAALIEAIKADDELAFQIRVLTAENASLKKAKAAVKTAEETAALEGAKLGLDITPTFTNDKGEKIDKFSLM